MMSHYKTVPLWECYKTELRLNEKLTLEEDKETRRRRNMRDRERHSVKEREKTFTTLSLSAVTTLDCHIVILYLYRLSHFFHSVQTSTFLFHVSKRSLLMAVKNHFRVRVPSWKCEII